MLSEGFELTFDCGETRFARFTYYSTGDACMYTLIKDAFQRYIHSDYLRFKLRLTLMGDETGKQNTVCREIEEECFAISD